MLFSTMECVGKCHANDLCKAVTLVFVQKEESISFLYPSSVAGEGFVGQLSLTPETWERLSVYDIKKVFQTTRL